MNPKDKKKLILLHPQNRGVYYNNDSFVSWKNTNFPDKENFGFSERHHIFWEVEMLRYNREAGELQVKVVNYHPQKPQAHFTKQNPKSPVLKIAFGKLDWRELRNVLNSYQPNAFTDICDFTDSKNEGIITDTTGHQLDFAAADVSRVQVQFKFPLIKTTFKMGCVEVSKKIKGFMAPVCITLHNTHIIPEFDHVKPYFAKALGTRKIEVKGYIEIREGGEIVVHCQSKEIAKINDDLITSVKRLQLKKAIFQPNLIQVDKSLFTPEEYFDGIEEDALGNTFKMKDQNILGEILNLTGIRNRKQLIYLSGKLQSPRIGMRFTLSPKFGFLFCVEGEEMDHFIWELLNTHATYIWSISKEEYSTAEKLKLIELQINSIRDHGRRTYLASKTSPEIVFKRIRHEGSQSGVKDGFPKWKARVNEIMV